MCLEASFLAILFLKNSQCLFRLKISLARLDELDENSTCPTSDLNRKYKQASGFLEA